MAASKAPAAKKATEAKVAAPKKEYLWVNDSGDISDGNFSTEADALADYARTDNQDDVEICQVVASYQFGFIKKS